ncbi:MAG: hypothetical protein EA412_09535 [Chitinophagaceae bacterium]|nr:MAG: hypothetical protein EA412_09535 [Chitinophagaceae bacterium]
MFILLPVKADEWHVNMFLETNAVIAKVDAIGNIYLITNEGTLIKYNREGKEIADFRERRFGKPGSLDVTNPMKIYLLYPEYSRVVVLDNMLNTKGVFDLNQRRLNTITNVAFSVDNNFWVYDKTERQVKKLSDNLEVLHESDDFRMLFNFDFDPVFMIERNNLLHISDGRNGIALFDLFGSFSKFIPLESVSEFSVDKNWIYYIESNSLKAYNTRLMIEESSELPNTEEYISAVFKNNQLVVLTSKGLTLYQKR